MRKNLEQSNILLGRESVRELIWQAFVFLFGKKKKSYWPEGNFKITVQVLPLVFDALSGKALLQPKGQRVKSNPVFPLLFYY